MFWAQNKNIVLKANILLKFLRNAYRLKQHDDMWTVFKTQDMQRLPEAVQYIEKASMMYVENGTPDTAAMALDRAGKCVHRRSAYTVTFIQDQSRCQTCKKLTFVPFLTGWSNLWIWRKLFICTSRQQECLRLVTAPPVTAHIRPLWPITNTHVIFVFSERGTTTASSGAHWQSIETSC